MREESWSAMDGAAQQPSGPEDVLLADEVVERRGPQARRQRLFALDLVAAARGEQVRGRGSSMFFAVPAWIQPSGKDCTLLNDEGNRRGKGPTIGRKRQCCPSTRSGSKRRSS